MAGTRPAIRAKPRFCRLFGSDGSCHNQKQHQRNDDASRRRTCVFNNNCWFNNGFCIFAAVAASESRCCSHGQCCCECDFFIVTSSIYLQPIHWAQAPKTICRKRGEITFRRQTQRRDVMSGEGICRNRQFRNTFAPCHAHEPRSGLWGPQCADSCITVIALAITSSCV